MRIGFDARWYNDSGVGAYVAGLLRAIAAADRGFELLVYEDPQKRVPGLEGQAVGRVPVHAPRYSLSEQWELGRRARQDRLDVFHSPFYVAPLAPGCPVVVTIHDLIPFRFRMYPWAKQGLVKMGYRTAVWRARQLIAVSEQTALDIQERLGVPPGRVTVVHNGAAEAYFHPDSPAAESGLVASRYGLSLPYVVAASARNWRTKNLESALNALRLARTMTDAAFQTVVYGPREGLTALGGEQKWMELDLICPGYLPAADLAGLLRHARAFIMPSLYEGFGLPILEAMSCGCPVVTSNYGALAEVAGSGAQTFDPFDVPGMAEAIVALLRDPAEVQRWRQRALSRAADFSWTKAATETISVYYRACNLS